MCPSNYIKSREVAQKNDNEYLTTLVDDRPYLPNLKVDVTDESSVIHAALATVVLSTCIAATKTDTNNHSISETQIDGGLTLLELPVIDWDSLLKDSIPSMTCTKVTGGITNALFRVSGFQKLSPVIATIANHSDVLLLDYDSVLIRIFGAEGMINRDVETSTYAALCNVDIAYRYLGRFANGRIEGWLDGYQPLSVHDLHDEPTSLEIAKEMARLHCLFEVPEGELRNYHCGVSEEDGSVQVGLWDQLKSWMRQAKGYDEFRTQGDTERVSLLELDRIEEELNQIMSSFGVSEKINGGDEDDASGKSSNGGRIVFCHNDLLAANIMRHAETNKIQLIDFEYGGTNYAAFDMANHFNEHAGGTSAEENGQTDYTKFPKPCRQQKFCVEYVKTMKSLENSMTESSEHKGEGIEEVAAEDIREEAKDLLDQVHKFILVNHLYWGLWAVNQAAEEGCEEFDFIAYATNRFKEFHARKADWEKDAN